MKGKFLTLLTLSIGMVILASPMSAKAAEMETSFPNFETTANHENKPFETTEMVFENVLDEAEKESNWRTVESEECDNETMDTVTDETEETKDVTTNQEMLPIDVEMQIQEEIVAEEAADSTVLIPKSYAIPFGNNSSTTNA